MHTVIRKYLNPRLFAFMLILLIVVSHAAMAAWPDIGRQIPEMIGLSGLIIVLLAAYVFMCETYDVHMSPVLIVGVAVGLRLMFIFGVPTLSDDIYRYVFDGRMLLAGHNPYAVSPTAAAVVFPEMAGLAARVNHPGLVTIYPPAAQFVFAAGAWLDGVFSMKSLLVLLDILSCVLIVRMLAAFRLPPARAVLYAWHPLAVIEIAGSGHIDAAAICFFFMALSLLIAGRAMDQVYPDAAARPGGKPPVFFSVFPLLSGMMCAAAVLVKFYPLIFLPGLLMLIRTGDGRWFWTGFMTFGLLLIRPFLPDFLNSLHTLDIYAQTWEFSGFAFRILRELTGNGRIARSLLAFFFFTAVVGCYGHAAFREKARPIAQRVLTAYYGIFLAWLFFTPTLHPWYALCMVSFIPFTGGPAGTCLSWSVLIAYRVLIPYKLTGQWIENDATALMIISAPVAAFLLSCLSAGLLRRLPSHKVENATHI